MSFNRIFTYMVKYKNVKQDNFLANNELYFYWNHLCLAASITQANIISSQIGVTLTRMTKMLHLPQCPVLCLFFPIFPPEEPLVLRALFSVCSVSFALLPVTVSGECSLPVLGSTHKPFVFSPSHPTGREEWASELVVLCCRPGLNRDSMRERITHFWAVGKKGQKEGKWHLLNMENLQFIISL